MDLLSNFKAYIQKENLFIQKDKLLLAVSGGADSAALCALCAMHNLHFSIAHCNFKLRAEESDRDENFVRELASQYNVPFFVKEFDTITFAKNSKTGIEETARNLRYTWFNELLHENNFAFLLTAHHADDNIETVIMNFFRGTGVKGLRGILPKQGVVVRPLLFARRAEIENFVAQNNIVFVTDSTNTQSDYSRNYFRNELIPAIENIYPNTTKNILNNINRLLDVELLYNDSINTIKLNLIEKKGNEFYIPVLKLAKAKPIKTIIHEIIQDFGFTAAQVGEVLKLLNSESGKYITSDTHRILRNRNWLIISPKITNTANTIHIIEEETTDVFFDENKLNLKKISTTEAFSNTPNIACIDASQLQFPLLLRKWKQGDYFYPLGMQKKKKLSRFFSDIKLSLAQKENVWVIESNKKIVWVVGYRIDDRFKITSSSVYFLKLSLTT